MPVCNCGVCGEALTVRVSAVVCEGCEVWYHMACVGFKSSTKALVNDNLMYFCDPCKEVTRNMWRSYWCRKEEKSVQTEDSGEKTEKSVQTKENPKEMKSSKTEEDVVGPQPSRQEEGPRQQHTMEMRKKKVLIKIIGDSMVKMMSSQVKCRMRGSGCTSLSGAKITDISKKVEEEAASMEDRMLIIQGGGNGLEYVGEDETVRNVVDAVKCGRQGPECGRRGCHAETRGRPVLRASKKIHQQKTARGAAENEDRVDEGKERQAELHRNGRVVDQFNLYEEDGVHLNNAGTARIGRRLCEWVRARSLQPMDQ
ncbi:hypothetical protein E2C01_069485 [Portunus trituberculatus]|uniref:PHD-type domain-containing protein n=1 Tax=Portunus trituberculatus TaxID=210409 RepID=A0A5B7HRN2_PORTR|nr:hypothetical protein [Portunus trituberculatus]